MNYSAINLEEKFAKFSKCWSPKIIAQMNDYHFKIARLQGDFVWHQHEDTDEVFFVIAGECTIDFREDSVHLKAGELFVVPKGLEHKPRAEQECQVMLIEPAGTLNTGDTRSKRSIQDVEWI